MVDRELCRFTVVVVNQAADWGEGFSLWQRIQYTFLSVADISSFVMVVAAVLCVQSILSRKLNCWIRSCIGCSDGPLPENIVRGCKSIISCCHITTYSNIDIVVQEYESFADVLLLRLATFGRHMRPRTAPVVTLTNHDLPFAIECQLLRFTDYRKALSYYLRPSGGIGRVSRGDGAYSRGETSEGFVATAVETSTSFSSGTWKQLPLS